MKKIVLLIIAVFGSLSCIAQGTAQVDEVWQPDTIDLVYDKTPSTFKLVCRYEPDGSLSHSRMESTSDSLWIWDDRQYYYDENLNCTLINRVSDSYLNNYEPVEYWYEYYHQDNLLSAYCEVWLYHLVPSWIDSVAYERDELDRITKRARFFPYGKVEEATYSYNGNQTTIVTEGNYHFTWQFLKRETLEYSDDGRLLAETTTDHLDNNVFKTYEYSQSGKPLSVLTRRLVDGDWTNDRLLQYNYDANEHLVLAEIKSWTNGAFFDTLRAVYELNENGYPVVVTFEKRDNEGWSAGMWQPEFQIFSDGYLKTQNELLCQDSVQRIEIHYTKTTFPAYDLDEQQAEQEMCLMRPNPTGGVFIIEGLDLSWAEVFNTLGQRVASVQGQGETLQINIANLPAGIYFVNVTDSEGRKCVKKVVKE